jgi:predicted alpha/beta hydrolase
VEGPRPEDVAIPARDGYPLAGTLFRNGKSDRGLVVVNAATAVPRRFYRHLAAALADAGYDALTWDYRGIGGSRPPSLRGFDARARDWVLLDMAGVVDWAVSELRPERIFLVGHSFGGQTPGLLDNASVVDGMATMSAQSGYWGRQGGVQKLVVFLHAWLSLPLLPRILGFMPMRRFGLGEDLPRGVAMEWGKWCRNRSYLLGDASLPLHRYADFTAPVLAYSFGDDAWGTPASVDAMMSAYPNVERRHVDPGAEGLASIGHVGFFRPASKSLWDEMIKWLEDRGRAAVATRATVSP